MVLGFAQDTDRLMSLTSSHNGKLLDDPYHPGKRLVLSIQTRDGSEYLYAVEFGSDEDLRSFLEDAHKYLHLKAVLEIEEPPFYVFCRVRRYEGSAKYDPSLALEDN